MAKWDLSKLPEGRKPLPDEWFAERAQMQETIDDLTRRHKHALHKIDVLEERLEAAENDAKEAEAYAGELEAELAKAVDALGEAIYLLDPDEEDIAKETGFHRIVTTYAELTGGKDDRNP